MLTSASGPTCPGMEDKMDNPFIYIALVILVLGALLTMRYRRANQAVGKGISEWCREWEVPDVPFEIEAAVRDVMAGTRPGIPRDGQWWTAMGVEQVGNASRTRLLNETPVPSVEGVYADINKIFELFGGAAEAPPHIQEGRFLGPMTSVHQDIILARITGRYRPIGAWMVAVPPPLIDSRP